MVLCVSVKSPKWEERKVQSPLKRARYVGFAPSHHMMRAHIAAKAGKRPSPAKNLLSVDCVVVADPHQGVTWRTCFSLPPYALSAPEKCGSVTFSSKLIARWSPIYRARGPNGILLES